MSAADPHAEFAPAKINLYLHITGRQGDGYHLLDSLAVFPDIGDRVIARPAPTLSLELAGAFAGDLGAGEDNLVLAAARALAASGGGVPGGVPEGVPEGVPGAALRLEKNLPVASGIASCASALPWAASSSPSPACRIRCCAPASISSRRRRGRSRN